MEPVHDCLLCPGQFHGLSPGLRSSLESLHSFLVGPENHTRLFSSVLFRVRGGRSRSRSLVLGPTAVPVKGLTPPALHLLAAYGVFHLFRVLGHTAASLARPLLLPLLQATGSLRTGPR